MRGKLAGFVGGTIVKQAFCAGFVGFLGFSALAVGGCSTDGGGVDFGKAPRIEVTERAQAISNGDTIMASAGSLTRIIAKNSGTGQLKIRGIEIVSDPEGAFTVSTFPTPTVDAPIVIDPEGEQEISIGFNATAAAGVARPHATVTIRSNRTLDGVDAFVVNVAPETQNAKLIVNPQVVDFGVVAANQSSTKQVALLNIGSAPLEIRGFYFSGNPGYHANIDSTDYAVTPESASTGVTFPAAVIMPAGASQYFEVQYTATGAEAAEGTLVFLTNDPSAPNGTNLQLFANVAGPCIKVNPPKVDFGGKVVGQLATVQVEIKSCGDRPLQVTGVEITNDGGGVFDADDAALGALPVTIEPNASVFLPVTYMPTQVSALDGSGAFIKELGTLRITSNAYLAQLDVDLSGFGTDGSCPTAVIDVREGDEVIPQTTLHLDSSHSTSTSGAISRVEWVVIQPPGSASRLQPSETAVAPTFEANIVGEYYFRLKVWDALNNPSCSDAEYKVVVTSTEALHVELLWHNPADINETDEGDGLGSDVDLHFMHPNAAGRYFDSIFDVFFLNPNPNWAGFGTNDDPRLDRDDTDGAGPENLNLDIPQFNMQYRVGANYWNDWGYGPAYTTVRVYIWGQLRFHWDDVKLIDGDMWDACTIDWPTEKVTPVTGLGGSPVITPGFAGENY